MEVTNQHKVMFFLSHALGLLPHSLRTSANGKYEIFESRIHLAYTKLLTLIFLSLQTYGFWCALASNFIFVPELFSRTIYVFAYLLLLACTAFTFWKTITERKTFRFWFTNLNSLQFDNSIETNPKKLFDTDFILLVIDLLWLLALTVYDAFFFRRTERLMESTSVCQMFYVLDFTSLIHFAILWEVKIFCRCFMLFGTALQKFYRDTNMILRGGRRRPSKRFWLNQLKDLRIKDLQAKDLVDFLHSFYIPVVLGAILWGFSSALVTLSARTGIETMVQCIWAIYVFWDIILILTNCQSLEKEAGKTAQSLQQLFVNCDDVQIKEEVELFSLQALHKKIEFDALGFFRLDFTLLYSIIGSLTSYVVILSQFQDESIRPKTPCKRAN